MTITDEKHPLKASIVASNVLRLEGVLSLPTEPRQIQAAQVDLAEFMRNGFIAVNGSAHTVDVIAYPRDVVKVAAGEALPNGQVCERESLYLTCLLVDSDKARAVWGAPDKHWFGVARGTWEANSEHPARVRAVGVYPLTATTESEPTP